jgi:hypothetical protein
MLYQTRVKGLLAGRDDLDSTGEKRGADSGRGQGLRFSWHTVRVLTEASMETCASKSARDDAVFWQEKMPPQLASSVRCCPPAKVVQETSYRQTGTVLEMVR